MSQCSPKKCWTDGLWQAGMHVFAHLRIKNTKKIVFSTEFFSSSANDNKFLKITYMHSISFYEFTVKWFNGKLFVLHMPCSTLERAHCPVPEDHNLTVTGPSL